MPAIPQIDLSAISSVVARELSSIAESASQITRRDDRQEGVPYPPPPWIICFVAVPVFAIAMGLYNANSQRIEKNRYERERNDPA